MNKYPRDTHLYVTEDDFQFIKKICDRDDLSVSQYLRRLIRQNRNAHEAREILDNQKVEDFKKREIDKGIAEVLKKSQS